VRSDVTGAALADVFKEVDGVRSLALPTAELDRARNALLLSLPGQFETNAFTASRYAGTWALGLPDSHVTAEPGRLRAVTARQVLDAARGAIDPSALIVVAVGDGAKIGPQIQQLGRVPVQRWDLVGRPLP
jgi:zinc protease